MITGSNIHIYEYSFVLEISVSLIEQTFLIGSSSIMPNIFFYVFKYFRDKITTYIITICHFIVPESAKCQLYD